MAIGDQQGPEDVQRPARDSASGATSAEARQNLLLAAVGDGRETAQTWSRNDGGRYFDQPQQGGLPNPNNRFTDIPTVNGHMVRIDPRTSIIDVYGPDNRRVSRGRLERDRPTSLRIGETELLVNPQGYIDVRTQKGFERQRPGGVREHYEKGADNSYSLTERRFPDQSYERYSNGKLSETNHQGFITKFDANGRKTEVSTPQGDKYTFKNAANGKVDSYEVTTKGASGQPVVTERATRGADGNLRIERRQPDGSMKVDESMRNRKDVALRADLKLDYLDQDGYGMPDANGRSIKRDDRTVMAQARNANGEMVPYPVNPIRSVKLPDGRQIDYEYSADAARARGQQVNQDGLQSYTVRDRQGKVIEFAQKIPEIPNEQRSTNTGWFEYKAKPGQSLPADQINRVKQLMAPADPSTETPETARARMMRNREELQRTRPMVEFMPTNEGQQTVSVGIDHISGKQYNSYANGETLVRNELGQDVRQRLDRNSGDSVETYPDGTTRRRAWDARPNGGPNERVTVTAQNAEGLPRVELHHSRRDNSVIDINYGRDGKTPTEVIMTQPTGLQIRMAPDGDNRNSWLEYRREGNAWKATGRAFPMNVELVARPGDAKVQGQDLPAGTVIISQGDKRRAITPRGEEIVGKVGATPKDLVPERVFVTPPLPQEANPNQSRPPDWTQQGPVRRQQGQPQMRPDRRQQGEPQVPRVRR